MIRLRPGGDFVKPGVYADLGMLNPGGSAQSTIELYLEGRRASEEIGDTYIIVALDPDGPGPAGYVHR